MRGTYRIREIDRVIVKGKTKPVNIFEVLDFHDEVSFPNLMEAVNYFTDGLGHYRGCRWEKAIKAFNEVLRLNPEDNLTKMYIERCNMLKETPPDDDWDGVWKMTSK